MSNLKERYSSWTTEKLIRVIESGEDYTLMAKDVASEVLKERNILPESAKAIAIDYWTEEINQNLKEYIKSTTPPLSKFLELADFKAIFETAFSENKNRLESMQVDSTKYWYV